MAAKLPLLGLSRVNTIFFLAISLLLSTSLAQAEGYWVELGGARHFHTKLINPAVYGDGVERSPHSTDFDATFYFGRVNDRDSVYGEAAFLAKASSASLSYRENPFVDVGNKNNGFALGVHGVIAERFILGASYSEDEYGREDLETTAVEAGLYISDNASLTLVYEEDGLAGEVHTHAGLANAKTNIDSERLGLQLHMVTSSDNAAFALDLSLAFLDLKSSLPIGFDTLPGGVKLNESDQPELGAQATLYPHRQLALVAGYKQANLDALDVERIRLAVEVFITRMVAVGIDYNKEEFIFNGLPGEIDDQVYKFGVKVRL